MLRSVVASYLRRLPPCAGTAFVGGGSEKAALVFAGTPCWWDNANVNCYFHHGNDHWKFARRTHRRANYSTFVSKHFELDRSDVEGLLQRHKIPFRNGSDVIRIKECMYCKKPHRNKPDNLYTLAVKKVNGAHFCHRCGSKGSWFDLKQKLGSNGDGHVAPAQRESAASSPRGKYPERIDEAIASGYCENLYRPSSSKDCAADSVRILDYLENERGLERSVLEKYNVGMAKFKFPYHDKVDKRIKWKEELCVSFPWMSRGAGEFLEGTPFKGTSTAEYDEETFYADRVKVRSLEHKKNQRQYPSPGATGLFGWHTVANDAPFLVITEGEFDAMAVHQATGYPSVSLPNGCNSFPVALLPALERFGSIVLWLDNDSGGQNGAEKMSKKLGIKRTRLVKSEFKDANDALRAGADIKALVDEADTIPHEQIVEFSELRNSVYQELFDPIKSQGVSYTMLPGFQDVVKGHRKSELTIYTGGTGSGKTTLLSQLSLDLARQGVRTMWASFEIQNTRLVSHMMKQYKAMLETDVDGLSSYSTGWDHIGSGDAPLDAEELARLKVEFDEIADQFVDLPLYFTRFFGSTSVYDLLDAMGHAVYVHDVDHIVIDNLQFMLGTAASNGNGGGNGAAFWDRWAEQDNALDLFRKFTTEHQIHLSLVVHPRKEHADALLSLSSVFGSVKATQEADNVVIIQLDEAGCKFIDVKKNRFDGSLGKVGLAFNKSARSFREVDL